MYYNINGLCNKNLDFFNDFFSLNVDVFCFSETHHETQYNNDKINEIYETREMLGSRLKTKGRATGGFFLGWNLFLFFKKIFFQNISWFLKTST